MVIQAGWHPLLQDLSLSPLLQGGARRLLSAKQLEGLDDEEELDDFLAEDDKSMYMVRTSQAQWQCRLLVSSLQTEGIARV